MGKSLIRQIREAVQSALTAIGPAGDGIFAAVAFNRHDREINLANMTADEFYLDASFYEGAPESRLGFQEQKLRVHIEARCIRDGEYSEITDAEVLTDIDELRLAVEGAMGIEDNSWGGLALMTTRVPTSDNMAQNSGTEENHETIFVWDYDIFAHYSCAGETDFENPF